MSDLNFDSSLIELKDGSVEKAAIGPSGSDVQIALFPEQAVFDDIETVREESAFE